MKNQWQIYARYRDGRDPNVWVGVCTAPADKEQQLSLLERMIRQNEGKLLAIAVGHWVARKGLKLLTATIREFPQNVEAPTTTASGPDLIRVSQRLAESAVEHMTNEC
jgi:hypothetical protein